MASTEDHPYSAGYETAEEAFEAYADDSRPSLSHEVIATYVGDAARSVRGVLDLHTSPWKGFSARMRETHSQGIVIRDTPTGTVDVEIHARVEWGVNIPGLAQKVEAAVRERVAALLSIDLSSVTLFIDEISGPMEVGTQTEG